MSATVAPLEEMAGGGRGGFGFGDAETMRMAIPGQTFGVRVNAVSQAPAESGKSLPRYAGRYCGVRQRDVSTGRSMSRASIAYPCSRPPAVHVVSRKSRMRP